MSDEAKTPDGGVHFAPHVEVTDFQVGTIDLPDAPPIKVVAISLDIRIPLQPEIAKSLSEALVATKVHITDQMPGGPNGAHS